jgi:hypothetical protein
LPRAWFAVRGLFPDCRAVLFYQAAVSGPIGNPVLIATPRICSSRALEANLSVVILLAYAFIRLQLHNLIIDKAIRATRRQG